MMALRAPTAQMTLVIGMALSLLISACTSQVTQTARPASATPSPVPPIQAPLPTTPPHSLEPTACRGGSSSPAAQCYDLIVPEHHGVSNGRTLRLHVAVYKSTAANRAPDPILFLMGGPGADGIGTFEGVGQNFPSFRGHRDVVVLDQRGTGHSVPKLTCPEYSAFAIEDRSKDRSSAESIELKIAAFRACHDRLVKEGVDPSAYNSAEIAADVEDLRRALGLERWNLFGWSYGTRIALTVMRDFPQGVRSVVLDSVYPPRVDQIAEIAGNTQTALHLLFDRCATDVSCNKAFPQLEKVFYDLLAELDAHPLRVGSTVLTGKRFVDLVLTLLFDPSAIRQLPKLIYDTHRGQRGLLDSKAYQVFSEDNSFADGMELSVDCGDEIRFVPPSTLATVAAGMNPHLAQNFQDDAKMYLGVCALWGARKAPDIETAPVVSDVPALLLAGDIDPFTPPAWARLAATTLSKSHVAEFPGLGHGLFLADSLTGRCVSQLVDSFLDNPTAEPDMRCLSKFRTQPVEFETS